MTAMDPIDRLAVLAAGLPGATVSRRRIGAPFEAVWRIVADLENSTPRYEPGVAEVRIVSRDGEELGLVVRDTSGGEDAMRARLRTGWCVMQSDTVVIAFAARPDGDGTLLAHLEHLRGVPGAGSVAKIDRELLAIEALATEAIS